MEVFIAFGFLALVIMAFQFALWTNDQFQAKKIEKLTEENKILNEKNKILNEERKKISEEYDTLAKQLTELSDISLSDDADEQELKKDVRILNAIAKAQQENTDEYNIERQIEKRVREMFDNEFPEYVKYYEEYKNLCENERLALKNFAQKIEPAITKKFPNLLAGMKMGRLHNSLTEYKDFRFADLNISAEIYSRDTKTKEENSYRVSLSECNCPDYKINKVPACKHMLFLSLSLGILQVYREFHREEFTQVRDEAEVYIKNKSVKNTQKETKKNSERSSLSDKTKKSTSYLRGSEEDM